MIKQFSSNNFSSKILLFTAVFLLGFVFMQGNAHAASYINLRAYLSGSELPMRTGDAYGPHGCIIRAGDTLETCDVEPGSSMTADGTLEWGAGFPSTLPAMGMGAPGLGYVPATYPINCFAVSNYPGHNNGNSTPDGRICEIAFDEPIAGTGNATYTINLSSSAVRGQKYLMGLTSNGGSNTLEVDFYLRAKPLACTISSFTCSGGALSWSTANCTNRTIDNGVGNVASSGSVSGTAGVSYVLNAWNAESNSSSVASCPAGTPQLNAIWTENSNTTINKTVTPGTTIDIPLNFSNVGDSGTTINNISCNKNVISGSIPETNVSFSANCSPTTVTKP